MFVFILEEAQIPSYPYSPKTKGKHSMMWYNGGRVVCIISSININHEPGFKISDVVLILKRGPFPKLTILRTSVENMI